MHGMVLVRNALSRCLTRVSVSSYASLVLLPRGACSSCHPSPAHRGWTRRLQSGAGRLPVVVPGMLRGRERAVEGRSSSAAVVRSLACVHASGEDGGEGEGEEEEEEEYEEISLPEVCPGCGVAMQIEDADGPGYCRVPERVMRMLEGGWEGGLAGEDEWEDEGDEAGGVFALEEVGEGLDGLEGQDVSQFVTVRLDDEDLEGLGLPGVDVDGVDTDGDLDDADDADFNDTIRKLNLEEQFSASASGSKPKTKAKREPKPRVFRDDEEEFSELDAILSSLVCARCYSLKHYGKVKSASAEAFLPDFDVAASVGEAIRSRQFRRAIVLVVVDLADFDGSLPRLTVQTMVNEYLHKNFTLVVAANKADLLPRQATKIRLENWVRKRMAQGGLPKPASVHIVSSQTGSGIGALLVDLQKSLGGRGSGTSEAGDVWVVGAQNAGKSSLINAMKKAAGVHRSSQEVTAAPMPGTTLGVVPVTGGLVPRGCEMLDTPGVRHEYQITSHLGPEEVRMLLPRRSLKPRTYRLGEGGTIHLGGLARLDVTSVPGTTMYVTVWVSDEVRTHLGKTDKAAQLFDAHVGRDLTPPVAADEADLEGRIRQDMVKPVSTDVSVVGDSWKQSSVDVCIAGLGWAAVGVSGEARLTVWAPPGVAITTRDAIVPDYAREFCKPGFDKLLQNSRSGSSGSGSGAKRKRGGKKRGG